MLIDMHVHPIFYDAIAEEGEELEFRKDAFGVWKQGPMGFDEIFAEWDICGVDAAALLPLDLTTTEGGCIVTNDQIARLCALYPERFFGFASVDPHRDDAEQELERAFGELGLRGLALHPGKQGFDPASEIAEPLYALCERYDRPVIFDAGLSWEPGAKLAAGNPLAFEPVAAARPSLRICLSHFAWPWVREMCALMLKYPNVYTDTALLYVDTPEEQMQELFCTDMGPRWFERCFPEQVMFGSNTPRFRTFKIKRALDAVPMRDFARKNLYGDNALRFLGIKEG